KGRAVRGDDPDSEAIDARIPELDLRGTGRCANHVRLRLPTPDVEPQRALTAGAQCARGVRMPVVVVARTVHKRPPGRCLQCSVERLLNQCTANMWSAVTSKAG